MKAETLQLTFSRIKTTLDAQSLNGDIQVLLNSTFYVASESLEHSLQTKISRYNAKIISDALLSESILPTETAKMQKLLEEIKAELTNISAVTLYIGFEPTLGLLEHISNWFKQNISQKTVVNIKQDENIIGGIVIIHKGIYKDYSLKKRIAAAFTAHAKEYKKYLG